MRLRFILPSVLILMMVMLAGNLSAAVVAQLDGPTAYGPGDPMVVLNNVTVGDEGYVEMEFQANSINGCLWYMADAWGGTSAGGEYRFFLESGDLKAALWNGGGGGYAVLGSVAPITASTDWHSVSMAWQEGSPTLVTLDGVTSSFTNAVPLVDFTSGTGQNVLGAYPNTATGSNFFDGSVRNMKLCDTYAESTSIVAQHDGPTTFVDSPMQTLPSVTIGDEGTIDLEFKADGERGTLWYMADAWGGTSAGGEYRLLIDNGTLYGFLWNTDSYAAQFMVPITEGTDWHSVSLTWKEGEETSLTLDGVTSTLVNTRSLEDFTSGEGVHVLGGYPHTGYDSYLFDGMTRNVVISDTYSPVTVPEPSVVVLLLTALGMLIVRRVK